MAFVAFAGVAMAALRTPTLLWASTILTIDLIIFLGAGLWAFDQRSENRYTWLGLSLFGGVTLILGIFSQETNVPLFPTLVIASYQDLSRIFEDRDDPWKPQRALSSLNATTVNRSPGWMAIANARSSMIPTGRQDDYFWRITCPPQQVAFGVNAFLFSCLGAVLGSRIDSRVQKELSLLKSGTTSVDKSDTDE